MGDMSMVGGLFMVTAGCMLGGFFMVTARMFMVFSGLGVVFSALLAHRGWFILRERSQASGNKYRLSTWESF